MSQKLTHLLGGDHRTLRALTELQQMTRDDSDVRLIADITARVNTVVRALGLDPRDTTAEEVYQALIAAAPQIDELAYFKDNEWLLAEFDGQIISFHPVDIIENYHHGLKLGEQRTNEAKKGLGYEIYRRYNEHPRTHDPAVRRVCDGQICWFEEV